MHAAGGILVIEVILWSQNKRTIETHTWLLSKGALEIWGSLASTSLLCLTNSGLGLLYYLCLIEFIITLTHT